jgi:hypothetical protein
MIEFINWLASQPPGIQFLIICVPALLVVAAIIALVKWVEKK